MHVACFGVVVLNVLLAIVFDDLFESAARRNVVNSMSRRCVKQLVSFVGPHLEELGCNLWLMVGLVVGNQECSIAIGKGATYSSLLHNHTVHGGREHVGRQLIHKWTKIFRV